MEGDDIPPPSDMDYIAVRLGNLLGAGKGSLDWQGLPFLAAYFGITDIDGLMVRLITLANYRPPRANNGTGNSLD